MQEFTVRGNVSCADCYFRQELLCARRTQAVCPTFRATVGRSPARARQAQLMPMTVYGTLAATGTDAGQPIQQVAATVTAPTPATVATVEPAPAAVAVTPVAPSAPAPQSRVAAAAREPRETCIVEIPRPASHVQAVAERMSAGACSHRARAGRIAERIAMRYPQASLF